MTTTDLIKTVKRQVKAVHFEQHGSKVQYIPPVFYTRFISTLDHCNDLPLSLALLYKGRKLPDRNYFRYVRFMSERVDTELIRNLSC